MKVRFLITKWIQEEVNITEEEFEELGIMNDEDKEDFFHEKARFFNSDTVCVEYYMVQVKE